ncbi:hypothetical protein [Mucilaginibacter celer]|uniref:DUF4440 domain-containing protein n=1 Tax=Mucilaginibacter celer TaxID=2305508 RepID=A0A494VTW3_9SPHI|nr:hypothetical protein [Mucilaginibacter celer]AYL96890.1 hypothetical protein HYN43_016965 [Mucilaginibacter celer]
MKKIFGLLLTALFPLLLHAQNPVVVKQQATIMAQSMTKGDYKTLINYTYPKAVQLVGGKEKMISLITTGMEQMKAAKINFESVTVGDPGKFYKAGKEIHCLLPETLIMSSPKGRIAMHSHLLAVSADGGKNWSFLDLNNSGADKVSQLIPNFNPQLKIPATTTEPLQ